MGKSRLSINPIPTLTLTLPLKGREARAPIIAHYMALGSAKPRQSKIPLHPFSFAPSCLCVEGFRRRLLQATSVPRNKSRAKLRCQVSYIPPRKFKEFQIRLTSR